MTRQPVIVALLLAGAMLPSAAVTSGISIEGLRYESGGVSDEELAQMRQQFGEFSFWLTTAAKGSGAYLADIQVRITDLSDNRLVLSHKMDGPWLLVALPPGRYLVDALKWTGSAADAEVQRRETTIGEKGQRQMVLYFDTGDDTDPTRSVPPHHGTQ